MGIQLREEVCLVDARGERLAVTVRTLDDAADHERFIHLEKEIWGQDFKECLPASALMINQKVGGLVASAFDADGRMLSLIYGLTGPCEGRLLHWSHMMGVHPDYRRFGLGRQMKLFQRHFLQALGGVDEVQWTYDPMESKNAHLNLNHLGALPVQYLHDVYGPGTGLHAGIGTDRFVVSWRINEARTASVLAAPLRTVPPEHRAAPAVNLDSRLHPATPALPDAPLVRIAIPRDIQAAKRVPGMGAAWRAATRAAFDHYFARGYTVVRFYSCADTDRGYYVAAAPGKEMS